MDSIVRGEYRPLERNDEYRPPTPARARIDARWALRPSGRSSGRKPPSTNVDSAPTVAAASAALDAATGDPGSARKVQTYTEYVRSGAYEARHGARGLRILTATTSPARRTSLKRISEEIGARNRFWFTTMDVVTPETVLIEPIWQVAGRNGLFPLVDTVHDSTTS
jgi:hypothetical protein